MGALRGGSIAAVLLMLVASFGTSISYPGGTETTDLSVRSTARVMQSFNRTPPADVSTFRPRNWSVIDVSPEDEVYARKFYECVNEHHDPKPMTMDAALNDTLSSVEILGLWWAPKRRVETALTVVSQASLTRLHQLRHQCLSWEGRMSAVIYFNVIFYPTLKDTRYWTALERYIKRAISDVGSLHQAMISEKHKGSCVLDVMLVMQRVGGPVAEAMYPVNNLRNLARLQSRTVLIAQLDVDMLVSSGLYRNFLNKIFVARVTDLCHKKKAVIVLPAFEVPGRDIPEAAELASTLVRDCNKSCLHQQQKEGLVTQFHANFWQGHLSTNYDMWFRADELYRVEHNKDYEPWFICDRQQVPWHDVRFRGYGKNKIVQVAATEYAGFEFYVHPTEYILHRAHQQSNSRTRFREEYKHSTNGSAVEITMHSHNTDLWIAAISKMKNGSYVPVVDVQYTECIKVLPWWGAHKNKKSME